MSTPKSISSSLFPGNFSSSSSSFLHLLVLLCFLLCSSCWVLLCFLLLCFFLLGALFFLQWFMIRFRYFFSLLVHSRCHLKIRIDPAWKYEERVHLQNSTLPSWGVIFVKKWKMVVSWESSSILPEFIGLRRHVANAHLRLKRRWGSTSSKRMKLILYQILMMWWTMKARTLTI